MLQKTRPAGNYFFEGGRTLQYHRVGNAVPPYLAKQLAEGVWDVFKRINVGTWRAHEEPMRVV